MTNHEEKLCKNKWMVTLNRVKELRQLLTEVQNGEILFWLDENWMYRSIGNSFPNDFISPHFTLTKENIRRGDKNVENVILNILKLLDLYYLYDESPFNSGISFKDYLRSEENNDISTVLNEKTLESLSHSYDFHIYNDTHEFSYSFKWSDSKKGIYIIFNNAKYGYTYFYDLIMFLLEESLTITEYDFYTQFCEEIRNFQRYYYKTTSDTDKDIITSETEVQLLNPENRKNRFDQNTDTYQVNPAVRIADVINYFNLDIEVSDKNLLNMHIDTDYLYTEFAYYDFLNNITVPEVEALVIGTIKGNFKEPFITRKYTCNYNHRFNFKVSNGNKMIECIVEWNYQEECYKYRKGKNEFLYFDSYTSLILYILLDFKDLKNFTWDKFIEDCVQLIKTIEKSSKVDINLNYLINRIKQPNVLDDLLYSDLPII
ncbi:hypothetical protein FHP05_10170 [Cerasibacillus terrae]|uniref:Uncharacterized protein n=1 Tax=Cerasibacillus terrae TaxID=2498845 RepID=A0A5C8NQM5_9BACI|nr:hypothetical protein [Cerasibacillus terrae]TXL64044.1 hypothetical protein FHP05_10170 [Cerasibacillus terrae]